MYKIPLKKRKICTGDIIIIIVIPRITEDMDTGDILIMEGMDTEDILIMEDMEDMGIPTMEDWVG